MNETLSYADLAKVAAAITDLSQATQYIILGRLGYRLDMRSNWENRDTRPGLETRIPTTQDVNPPASGA